MSEIEVGEYIRTTKGIIAKLEDIDIEPNKKYYFFDKTIYYDWGEPIDFLEEKEIGEYIKAHSKNIIDLIEAGDYVNGYKVVETYKNNELKGWQIGKEKEEKWLGVIVNSKMIKEPLQEYFDNNMIKTIVTKEMMKSVEYKIEGDMETN